jgi:hypothetical protein
MFSPARITAGGHDKPHAALRYSAGGVWRVCGFIGVFMLLFILLMVSKANSGLACRSVFAAGCCCQRTAIVAQSVWGARNQVRSLSFRASEKPGGQLMRMKPK